MKSWKTTVSAIVSAAGAFVLFANQSFHIIFPQIVLALASFIMLGGLVSLGVNGKDNNVTGGTRQQ